MNFFIKPTYTMNFFRKLLFKILGIETYLFVVSKLFFLSFNGKILKGKNEFDWHYFTEKLIKKGDVIIDLGANLGYYSLIFSKLTGKTGRVYSIEPVALYRKILKRNIRKRDNVVLIPYAIGANDKQPVKMGVPVDSSHFSHGRTHVLTKNDEVSSHTFDATLITPDTLFRDLDRLDYLKCDIEGYEGIALPLFKNILRKFRPLIQIEIDPQNHLLLEDYFRKLDYRFFLLTGERLKHQNVFKEGNNGDWLLIPAEKVSRFSEWIEKPF